MRKNLAILLAILGLVIGAVVAYGVQVGNLAITADGASAPVGAWTHAEYYGPQSSWGNHPQAIAGFLFNGSTWDRSRGASASNKAAATSNASVQVEAGPRWRVTSTPAVSTKASASKAAGGAGVRHICDCITFSAGSTTAPALTKLNVDLRDGATGAGTIIASYTVVIPAATGQNVAPHSICGLNLVGSDNTAMTLEFSALLTNLFQDLTISGYSVN